MFRTAGLELMLYRTETDPFSDPYLEEGKSTIGMLVGLRPFYKLK